LPKVIRVITVVGEVEIEEADAYTISPPNLPPPTNYITSYQFPPQTLPGSLKVWKQDPTGGEDHTLLAWFSPAGWVAIDFQKSEPITQLAIGFQVGKDDEQAEPQAYVPRPVAPSRPRTTSVPTPKTTPMPTPKTTPVEK
jgi:hypothetical protein